MKRELFYQSDKSSLKNGSLSRCVFPSPCCYRLLASADSNIHSRGIWTWEECVSWPIHIEERQHAVTHILTCPGSKALWRLVVTNVNTSHSKGVIPWTDSQKSYCFYTKHFVFTLNSVSSILKSEQHFQPSMNKLADSNDRWKVAQTL